MYSTLASCRTTSLHFGRRHVHLPSTAKLTWTAYFWPPCLDNCVTVWAVVNDYEGFQLVYKKYYFAADMVPIYFINRPNPIVQAEGGRINFLPFVMIPDTIVVKVWLGMTGCQSWQSKSLWILGIFSQMLALLWIPCGLKATSWLVSTPGYMVMVHQLIFKLYPWTETRQASNCFTVLYLCFTTWFPGTV